MGTISDTKVRERLRPSAILRAIPEAVSDALFAVDHEARLVWWNAKLQSLSGHQPHQLEDLAAQDLFAEDERPAVAAAIACALAEGQSDGVWNFNSTAGGGTWRFRFTAIPDGANETIGLLAAGQNVSGREHADEILARQLRDLEQAKADVEQFAYVASHDLQEPLRMVSSYLQLLARRYKGRLGQDADDFIDFAVDGATRMQALISDLLAYSRVGTRAQPFAATDLNQALERALASLGAEIEARSAVISRDPLPVLHADENQVVLLFQHLLDNALKFCHKPPRIHIGTEQRDGQWVLFVRDNGIGIDTQYADRIFVIFQRLHARDRYPGTGTGLAICKRIVDRRGGRLWVESEPGKGATFFFTMPQRGASRQ